MCIVGWTSTQSATHSYRKARLQAHVSRSESSGIEFREYEGVGSHHAKEH